MKTLHLEVFSDYLCPWCYVADYRLKLLGEEFAGRIRLLPRSYLLRPAPEPRDRERFVRYTRSWENAATEPDTPTFRAWHGDAAPPTHSTPAHLVAKAAARFGADAFARMHARLLRAYFEESLDISSEQTLRVLWQQVGLPDADFAGIQQDPELLQETLGEHRLAFDAGINGVPALRQAGADAFVLGAQPLQLYRRWFKRLLGEEAAQPAQ